MVVLYKAGFSDRCDHECLLGGGEVRAKKVQGKVLLTVFGVFGSPGR